MNSAAERSLGCHLVRWRSRGEKLKDKEGAFGRNARSSEVADGPLSGDGQADRRSDVRQQRASSTEALQQAAGKQGAAPDDQYWGERARADRSR